MHGFRDNEVLMQAGFDVIVISPPWGAARKFFISDSEWATPILYLFCIVTTSIVHRFQFNELFMFAGNDIIAILPLGDASGNFLFQILKGRSDFVFIFN